MVPVMCRTIARMGHSLPVERSAANPIRQPVPLSGQAEPDRPLSLPASRNRPAPGASSNEGGGDSGAQSNREGWPGWVREGGTRFLIRRSRRRTGDAVGGGPCPRGDRTQISEAPQAMESLHKCALRGADFCLVLRSAPELNELRSFSDWGLPEEALLA
jgi:hypothetical protein